MSTSPPSTYSPSRKAVHGAVTSRYRGTWEEVSSALSRSAREEKWSSSTGASWKRGHTCIAVTVRRLQTRTHGQQGKENTQGHP